jgi:sirohydrochlorin cobaltochelatase
MNRYGFIAFGYMRGGPYTWPMNRTGLILFAHGARDPRWAEPFERLRRKVEASAPGTPVALAYLEFMSPDILEAAGGLVARGCRALKVVPIFLGQGGHVRQDLPVLVARVEAAHPGVAVILGTAVGEDQRVLDRIAEICVESTGAPP